MPFCVVVVRGEGFTPTVGEGRRAGYGLGAMGRGRRQRIELEANDHRPAGHRGLGTKLMECNGQGQVACVGLMQEAAKRGVPNGTLDPCMCRWAEGRWPRGALRGDWTNESRQNDRQGSDPVVIGGGHTVGTDQWALTSPVSGQQQSALL